MFNVVFLVIQLENKIVKMKPRLKFIQFEEKASNVTKERRGK